MSNDNKTVREKLERIYGQECMLHQGLKIKGYSKSKIDYKGKSIRKQLTLHHIKPRSQGGGTTVENGAILCRGCHDYLEQTTPENRKRLNDALKRYKELKIALVDDIESEIEINLLELEATERGVKAKKLKYNRAKAKEEIKRQLKELEEK